MPNTRNKHRPYHHPHPRPDNNPNRPNKSHTLYTKNGPRQSMNTLFQNSPPNIQFPKYYYQQGKSYVEMYDEDYSCQSYLYKPISSIVDCQYIFPQLCSLHSDSYCMMLDKLSEEENVNGVNGGGNGGNCLNGGGNGGMNGMNSHKQDDNVRIYIDEPNLIDQLLMQYCEDEYMMDNRERRDDRIKVEEREQQVKIKKMSGEYVKNRKKMMKRLLSLAVFFRRNVEIVANFHHLRRNRCLGVYFMTVYKELIKECDKLEEGVKRGLAGLEFVEVLEGEGKILGLELGETLLPGILSVLLYMNENGSHKIYKYQSQGQQEDSYDHQQPFTLIIF